MSGRYQVPTKVEEILNSSMGSHEPLGLSHRFEPPHTSLPNPGRFMRLLGPIILILFGTMDHLRYQLSMCNTLATQFIGHFLGSPPWDRNSRLKNRFAADPSGFA